MTNRPESDTRQAERNDAMRALILCRLRWVWVACLVLSLVTACAGAWLAYGVWLVQAVVTYWKVRLLDLFMGRGK